MLALQVQLHAKHHLATLNLHVRSPSPSIASLTPSSAMTSVPPAHLQELQLPPLPHVAVAAALSFALPPPPPVPLWCSEDDAASAGVVRVVYLYAQGWTKAFPPPRLLQGFFSWHGGGGSSSSSAEWEITCVTLEDRDGLEPGRMVHSHCGKYLWLQGAGDDEVLNVVASLRPHAIVDLSSYTVLARPHVVSAAPACFKVNAVNYPSTMGGVFEDLLLTDRVASPPDANHVYGEKLFVMPSSGFPAFFADGAAELVPMLMRLSLMRDCGSSPNSENIKLCSSHLGDPHVPPLLSTPSPPPSTYIPLLLDFTRSGMSAPHDKASFIFVALTSLRASLLATRQFNGTDLFQLAEGYIRHLAEECAGGGGGDACLHQLMSVVGEFMEADPANEWPKHIFELSLRAGASSLTSAAPAPSARPLHLIETALRLLRCNISREADINDHARFMSPR
jgi:hypothetical protein